MLVARLTQSGDSIRGEFRTLTMTVPIAFVPVYSGRGSMAASHVVVANGVEVGAAWPTGPEAGAGLKVRIDDPTFPSPFVGTLTLTDEGEYLLVWKRPRWRG